MLTVNKIYNHQRDRLLGMPVENSLVTPCGKMHLNYKWVPFPWAGGLELYKRRKETKQFTCTCVLAEYSVASFLPSFPDHGRMCLEP